MRTDVQSIFRATPHEKQVMMFSATLSKDIRAVCKRFMQDVINPYHLKRRRFCGWGPLPVSTLMVKVFMDKEDKLICVGKFFVQFQLYKFTQKTSDREGLLEVLVVCHTIIGKFNLPTNTMFGHYSKWKKFVEFSLWICNIWEGSGSFWITN